MRAFLDRSSPLDVELAIDLIAAQLENYMEHFEHLKTFLSKLGKEDGGRIRLVGAKTTYGYDLHFVLDEIRRSSNISLGKTLQLAISNNHGRLGGDVSWEQLSLHLHGVQNLVLPMTTRWTGVTTVPSINTLTMHINGNGCELTFALINCPQVRNLTLHVDDWAFSMGVLERNRELLSNTLCKLHRLQILGEFEPTIELFQATHLVEVMDAIDNVHLGVSRGMFSLHCGYFEMSRNLTSMMMTNLALDDQIIPLDLTIQSSVYCYEGINVIISGGVARSFLRSVTVPSLNLIDPRPTTDNNLASPIWDATAKLNASICTLRIDLEFLLDVIAPASGAQLAQLRHLEVSSIYDVGHTCACDNTACRSSGLNPPLCRAAAHVLPIRGLRTLTVKSSRSSRLYEEPLGSMLTSTWVTRFVRGLVGDRKLNQLDIRDVAFVDCGNTLKEQLGKLSVVVLGL